MPKVVEYVESKALTSNASHDDKDHLPENTPLYLPSSFDAQERQQLNIVRLGQDEGKLREGAAHDAILAIRNAVKDLSIANRNDRQNG